MGAVLPIATQALAVFETVNTIANIVDNPAKKQDEQVLRQLEQQQALQQQQAQQDAVLSRAQIETQAQEAETERRNALKRAVARQRAAFGASGVAQGDGSSEAVLLGLFEESEEERENRERLDKLRIEALDQNLLQQSNTNTLARTQLEEKNKLTDAARLGDQLSDVSGLLDSF